MSLYMRLTCVVFFVFLLGCKSVESKPNIVFILTDDLGYGDVKSTNTESKNATPAIDRLSEEGMTFTDMHAAASWCVPSRYGLLTGAYPGRTDLGWTKKPVIADGEMTLPQMLRNNGYRTAMIGKWHLGFTTGKDFMKDKYPGGPVDRGFDYWFGIPHSLDIEPYLYIENDKAVMKPTGTVAAKGPSNPKWTKIQGEFWRKGQMSPDFDHNTCLDVLTERAVSEIKSAAAKDKPFFLYVPLTAPHTPWLPGEKFLKNSPNEMYGAFVAHVDDCVKRMDAALKESGASENTIFILTSDNGPVWYDKDIERTGHKSTGVMRGMKGDAWEGGHRVPFIVRWPAKIKAGSVTHELSSFTDVLPTMADIVGDAKHGGKFRDGHSMASVLEGGKTTRTDLMMLCTGRHYAARIGDWKYIPFIGSGGFTPPKFVKPKKGEPTGQLYNLAKDPGETTNLYSKYPEKVKELKALIEKYNKEFN